MNQSELQYLITNWVRDNFGQSEVDEPSWSIEALAAHLAEKISPKYNGWSNYATWKVNLEMLDGEADNIRESGETFESVGDLADHLEQMVDDYIEMSLDGTQEQASTVKSYAEAFLNEVNYDEIAQSMIDDNPEFLQKEGE